MTKATFVVLPTAATQIISGDSEIVDPALVRFDPHRDYPVTMPDGSITKGRLRLELGQLVIDLPIPDDMLVNAHFDMSGVRQAFVSLTAEIADIHAGPRKARLLQ